MIVRPEEISARRAPSTSPLNACETKLAQFTPKPRARTPTLDARSAVLAELAAERVRLLHQVVGRDDLDDLVVVLLALHVLLLHAAHDNDRADALVVLRAVVHVADQRGDGLALLVGLDDIGRIERAGRLDHAGPVGEADIGILGTPLGLVAVLLLEL